MAFYLIKRVCYEHFLVVDFIFYYFLFLLFMCISFLFMLKFELYILL
jgi:hypothetical protein